MPKIINLDVRRKVIEGCIVSGDISAIAKEFEISEATARSIVRQAAAGKIPEYTSRAAQIDDLVALSQALKASGKTLDQAATGLATFQGLTQAGVDPSTLKPATQILTRIAEPGFPTQKFVQAALKLD